MPGEYSHEHPVTVHEGPMADRRGTGWRQDAIKLEQLNQRQIESPSPSLPNNWHTIDKAHNESKSDEGQVDKQAHGVGGDAIKTER